MISYFEKLREDEVKLLYRTPLLVAILLAGADDKIDQKELKEAVSITKLEQTKGRNLLIDYYHEIVDSFESDLTEEIASLPGSAEKRNPMIVDELRRLNIILPKIDRKFAIQFYDSMKEIASTVAHASGGIFGYLSIGVEESRYVELNFIRNPARYKKPESKS
jgi:hypothetical protein